MDNIILECDKIIELAIIMVVKQFSDLTNNLAYIKLIHRAKFILIYIYISINYPFLEPNI